MNTLSINLIDKYECGHYSRIYTKTLPIYKIRLNMIPIGHYCETCLNETKIIKIFTLYQYNRKLKLEKINENTK